MAKVNLAKAVPTGTTPTPTKEVRQVRVLVSLVRGKGNKGKGDKGKGDKVKGKGLVYTHDKWQVPCTVCGRTGHYPDQCWDLGWWPNQGADQSQYWGDQSEYAHCTEYWYPHQEWYQDYYSEPTTTAATTTVAAVSTVEPVVEWAAM